MQYPPIDKVAELRYEDFLDNFGIRSNDVEICTEIETEWIYCEILLRLLRTRMYCRISSQVQERYLAMPQLLSEKKENFL